MSDWRYIYGEIDEKIHANGIKAISGGLLNEVLTKMIEAVDGNLPEAGTEYTAGPNITITNGEIDTKRVLELTDITIADGTPAIKIITTAGGKQAVAEGAGTTASGDYSHAEGGGTQATGVQSHAEGGGTKAIGLNSHAEGGGTTASGTISHAEGVNTTASGVNSHAEGQSTIASGFNSHAEGVNTTASGKYSHAEGQSTIARGDNSHAGGKFNIEDITGTYAVIVGNGTDNLSRSNAYTLDWQGNEVLAGKITANGVINGSLFFGLPITTTTLSGNATWNIDDLKNMMKVVLSSSTNGITLPNGGENPFRFQIIVAQDSTGSRALTISGASGVNVYNPSEFDFSGGGANQICVCTIIWDGTEYIYECTNYVGGE